MLTQSLFVFGFYSLVPYSGFHYVKHFKHRRKSEFESEGANWNVGGGAVGIEMPKFEAKKGDFAKIWQKLRGGAKASHSPQLRRPC